MQGKDKFNALVNDCYIILYLIILPWREKSNSLQTTLASYVSQYWSHTVPHRPFTHTSTRPSYSVLPPISRKAPVLHRATCRYRVTGKQLWCRFFFWHIIKFTNNWVTLLLQLAYECIVFQLVGILYSMQTVDSIPSDSEFPTLNGILCCNIERHAFINFFFLILYFLPESVIGIPATPSPPTPTSTCLVLLGIVNYVGLGATESPTAVSAYRYIQWNINYLHWILQTDYIYTMISVEYIPLLRLAGLKHEKQADYSSRQCSKSKRCHPRLRSSRMRSSRTLHRPFNLSMLKNVTGYGDVFMPKIVSHKVQVAPCWGARSCTYYPCWWWRYLLSSFCFWCVFCRPVGRSKYIASYSDRIAVTVNWT